MSSPQIKFPQIEDDPSIIEFLQQYSTTCQALLNSQPSIIKALWEELRYLRNRPLTDNRKKKMTFVDRPVASFTKPERLRHEMGTEITLIFRSSACNWASSESGGCTMCGYWNDRADASITAENYWQQFQSTIDKYFELLADTTQKIVFKMFTSGSFCDSSELPHSMQVQILRSLAGFESVKEIVIESRPEFVQPTLLAEYSNLLPTQYLEIGIGLESSSDYIRQNIINKGFTWIGFTKAVSRLHEFGFGVKAYLIFKPPFLAEYAAMMDLFQSIRDCLLIGVNTISINPTNIQQNTICEELQSRNQFRSPWWISLFLVMTRALTQKDLASTRVICDPSAASKERGIHNDDLSDPSNEDALKIIEKFVHTQEISVIPTKFVGQLGHRYRMEILSRKA